MNVIYEPRGAAAEYAPLAANLYRGCGHGCKYCYAPACLRMTAEEFHGRPTPRPRVLELLEKDAGKLAAAGRAARSRPVLLCFTCDPYQPLEATEHITREAIEVLGRAALRIRVLTKAPTLALRDMDLMRRYRAEFGISLSWADDERRREWEPHAEGVADRLAALHEAKAAGLATWVSIEPVIDAGEALAALGDVAGRVGIVKIGKLNHHPARERLIDWAKFARRATEICEAAGQAYYIKDDLMRACRGAQGIRRAWPAA